MSRVTEHGEAHHEGPGRLALAVGLVLVRRTEALAGDGDVGRDSPDPNPSPDDR
ncbi:MAG: hypothetical protein ACR2HY_05855 [Acidimicrobiales bacterium]